MAALKINRNIVAVECNAIQFLHSKLRAVSEPVSESSGVLCNEEKEKET